MADLAPKLREGTKEVHRAVENTPFIKDFMRGKIDPADYTRLITSLYHVYSALEDALAKNATHPVVAGVYFPEQLNRRAAALEDVAFFTKGAAPGPMSPNTLKYVERLRELSDKAPELLVAHAYTRYLGDLSGGLMMAKRIQTALNLQGSEGTKFYEFPLIGNVVMFKNEYREALNKLPIDDATADRIVEEAVHAFALNAGLFLDASPAHADETAILISDMDAKAAATTKKGNAFGPWAVLAAVALVAVGAYASFY